jgi:hypothetical protein
MNFSKETYFKVVLAEIFSSRSALSEFHSVTLINENSIHDQEAKKKHRSGRTWINIKHRIMAILISY